VVAGTVLLPNGRLARLDPSFFQRLAALGAEEAQALTGNVSPAPNVSVQLVWHHSNGVEDLIGSTVTDGEGRYQIDLPQGTDATTCRFMVSVGEGNDGTPPLAGTLTRAFVFSTVDPVDIDFVSEAVVRMILARVSAGDNLCSFSPATIQATVRALRAFPGSITGVSPQQLNSIAVKTATAAISIQATLGPPAPTPTDTVPPSPTATRPSATATHTVPPPIPTATFTVPPPTGTAIPTATKTVVPTATFTGSPSPTATLTNTSLPTQTPVPTATFTGSPLPTATFTDTSTPIPTATNTPPPTATNTPLPTNTDTPLPTATNTPLPTATPTTPGTAPQISIGSASGAPGSVVSVSISLTKNGPNVVTIAPLVFTFDPAVLTFGSCSSDVSGKNVDAVSPAAGHVSMVVSGGLTTIPDGAIAHCSFTISGGAPAGPSALTFVAAGMSDANQNDFTATGTSGAVTVTTTSGPQIAIGSASGAPGNVVSVAISLTKNGPNVVTIAPLVFTFDPAVLAFNGCTSDVSGKNVDAVSPSAGHVSLVVSGGLTTISDGAIAHCGFTIAGGAPAGPSALTFVAGGMSDSNQNDFTATGTSGSVTVTTTSGPQIAIGSASGAPGSVVSVAISLTKNGPDIVTIAPLVFTFDPAVQE
jgi:Cohesin domain